MFKVGETVWTRYAGRVWMGEVSEVLSPDIVRLKCLPGNGMVGVAYCFRSEVAQAEAYARAEGIVPAARRKAAALRDEARELEAQAEHLRRSAFEVERDAPDEAARAITSAPR